MRLGFARLALKGFMSEGYTSVRLVLPTEHTVLFLPHVLFPHVRNFYICVRYMREKVGLLGDTV